MALEFLTKWTLCRILYKHSDLLAYIGFDSMVRCLPTLPLRDATYGVVSALYIAR